MSPTDADKKILNAVPVRPNNPSVPKLYDGPTLAADKSKFVKNTFWMQTRAEEFAIDNHLHLVAGKAFGSTGTGTSDNVDATATTKNSASIGLGVVFKPYTTGTTCELNYLMFQAGHLAVDTAAYDGTKKQNIVVGAKEAAVNFDSIGTAPTAAADPKTPSTGATMLAAGAASLAVAMTLF